MVRTKPSSSGNLPRCISDSGNQRWYKKSHYGRNPVYRDRFAWYGAMMFFAGLLADEGDLEHDSIEGVEGEADELVLDFLQACCEVDVENSPVEVGELEVLEVN